ncbi:MAG: response regulator transcription factor [Bacteroidota bacterium]
MIRVLIIDDHQMFMEGIQSLLAEVPDILLCGKASRAEIGLRWLATEQVEVILLDIDMPDMGGLELLPILTRKHPDTAVIMLTLHRDGETIKRCLETGAKGFLLKDTDKTELLLAIRSVAEGGQYYAREVSSSLLSLLASAEENHQAFLSAREQEVLTLIAEGLSSAEIATQLGLGTHTIHTYRKNLLRKFSVSNTAALVMEAIRQGYLQADPRNE